MYKRLSELVSAHVPCFFFSDFKGERFICYALDELSENDIEFAFHSECSDLNIPHKPVYFPIKADDYHKKFEAVQEHIRCGNTYLLNLTQPTQIVTPYTLKEIYTMANAPYKMRVRDEFVCFSPEPFITITQDTIHTYPMKGTIDASIPNAIEMILNDPKETAEHTMIVDLLRNDLGIIAKNIRVEEFRFISTINTGTKKLHQVSSHISGTLETGWRDNVGELLRKLLPAGSISGTPKKKTIEIIESVEEYDRGFFTGVFGYYDGETLYSAVAIRYIESSTAGYLYKSGGGITAESDWSNEYAEMIDKVYIP